jgi:hypothetical protein
VSKREAMLGSDPTMAGSLLETPHHPLEGPHLASRE